MDVPSPAGGVVREVLVKVGDKVSQGTAVARLEVKEELTKPAATQLKPAPPEEPAAEARPPRVPPFEHLEPEKPFVEEPPGPAPAPGARKAERGEGGPRRRCRRP